VAVSDKSDCGRRYYVCECRCEEGNVFDVYGYSLVSGATRSCGCLFRENRSTIGGLRAAYPKEYGAWYRARERAKKDPSAMAPAWKDSFSAFLKDMGPSPKQGTSRLKLADRGRGYWPENCHWQTK
jgi:hypothetical protein